MGEKCVSQILPPLFCRMLIKQLVEWCVCESSLSIITTFTAKYIAWVFNTFGRFFSLWNIFFSITRSKDNESVHIGFLRRINFWKRSSMASNSSFLSMTSW